MNLPDWFFWFAPAWLMFLVLLSVWFRRTRGKAIITKIPATALYSERSASATMASNCLIVAVTPDALIVTPRFPFNLMFLPEVYGLEHDIPLSTISDASAARAWWGGNVSVSYGEQPRRLRLKVRDPAAFVDALRHPGST